MMILRPVETIERFWIKSVDREKSGIGRKYITQISIYGENVHLKFGDENSVCITFQTKFAANRAVEFLNEIGVENYAVESIQYQR